MQGDLIVTLHDGAVDHMGDGLCSCAPLQRKTHLNLALTVDDHMGDGFHCWTGCCLQLQTTKDFILSSSDVTKWVECRDNWIQCDNVQKNVTK